MPDIKPENKGGLSFVDLGAGNATVVWYEDGESRTLTINSRIARYIEGWEIRELYQDKVVSMRFLEPGETTGETLGECWPIHYFEYPPGKEAQLYLGFGWKWHDLECVIVLGLHGDQYDKKDPGGRHTGDVIAEITRFGGAEMKALHNEKHIVTFPAYDLAEANRSHGYYGYYAQNMSYLPQ